MSTKHGHNIYDNEILDEFKNSNICNYLPLNKEKLFNWTLFTSTNINQSAPNLVTLNMSIRSRMSLIMVQVIPDQLVFSVLEVVYVHTQLFLALYMCVFILNGFPCGYF